MVSFLVYSIPLPKWAVEEIDKDPDLVYTDQWGRRNYEYLSLGCDTLPVLKGRTPVQHYADFMSAFRDNFKHALGDTIVVIAHPYKLLSLINSFWWAIVLCCDMFIAAVRFNSIRFSFDMPLN
jgi:hypothetical protein